MYVAWKLTTNVKNNNKIPRKDKILTIQTLSNKNAETPKISNITHKYAWTYSPPIQTKNIRTVHSHTRPFVTSNIDSGANSMKHGGTCPQLLQMAGHRGHRE